jgi:hypothetical protein
VGSDQRQGDAKDPSVARELSAQERTACNRFLRDLAREGYLPFIMQLFFRGQNTKKPPGTGLGLSPAWQILKLRGGDLEIESQQDRGTKATMIVPETNTTGLSYSIRAGTPLRLVTNENATKIVHVRQGGTRHDKPVELREGCIGIVRIQVRSKIDPFRPCAVEQAAVEPGARIVLGTVNAISIARDGRDPAFVLQ